MPQLQQHQILNPLHHSGNSPKCFLFYFILLSFVLLGLHLQHMEVPRLGVKSELLLPAYARATAMQDPSRVFDLHHSLWQRQILNPLSEARDQTGNLMVPSQIRSPLHHDGSSPNAFCGPSRYLISPKAYSSIYLFR